jgi:hypothetical protein
MASPVPLSGIELIDCAKANANQGIKVAATQCGYNDDIVTFERELYAATQKIGVKLHGFQDLNKSAEVQRQPGIEVAPDTATEL